MMSSWEEQTSLCQGITRGRVSLQCMLWVSGEPTLTATVPNLAVPVAAASGMQKTHQDLMLLCPLSKLPFFPSSVEL